MFGAEENLLASDYAQQSTTNDAAFLVIPAEAGIQKNALDTGVRRYDGWAFEVLPSPLARRITRNPMSTVRFPYRAIAFASRFSVVSPLRGRELR